MYYPEMTHVVPVGEKGHVVAPRQVCWCEPHAKVEDDAVYVIHNDKIGRTMRTFPMHVGTFGFALHEIINEGPVVI